jgi:hypothetical protein
MKFVGNVSESGVLTIVNRKLFDEFVREFSGKQVSIEVTKKINQRSSPQNRYYFGCVLPIVRDGFKDLGHKLSIEDTHLFLKNRFLEVDMVSEDGELIGKEIRSTKDLTKAEFGDYISEIQMFASEILNVYIPDANEQVKLIE